MAQINRLVALVLLVVTAPLVLTGWAIAAWWPTSFLVFVLAAIAFWTVAAASAADDPSQADVRVPHLRTA